MKKHFNKLFSLSLVIFLVSGCSNESQKFDQEISEIIAFGQTRPIPQFDRIEIAYSEIQAKDSNRFYDLDFIRNHLIYQTTDKKVISKFISNFGLYDSNASFSANQRGTGLYHFLFFSNTSNAVAYVLCRNINGANQRAVLVSPIGENQSMRYNSKVLPFLDSVQ